MMSDLIAKINTSYRVERLKGSSQSLLVIDESGYKKPIKDQAEMFLAIISNRYERTNAISVTLTVIYKFVPLNLRLKFCAEKSTSWFVF